jgi:hypothetical protein
MPAVKKPTPKNASPGFNIDGRVSIAFDALSDRQKKIVGGLLSDRERFVAGTSERRKIRKVSESDPIYALSASTGLNIIYKLSGADIEILDLMGDATLQRFATKRRSSQPKAAKKTAGVVGGT